jgi:hypothetical protein
MFKKFLGLLVVATVSTTAFAQLTVSDAPLPHLNAS